MNALHLILYHLAKLHVPCHTDSFLHDGHFVCANHCISKCTLCLLILHVPHTGDTLEYLECDMTSTSSNYESVHDYRFHGDEVFDPRSDLSQGRGDDTEYPMIIPMFTRRDLNYTQLDTRFTRSSLNLHFLHVRHAYYLKYMCYACSGTPKETMENPRTKAKCARKRRKKGQHLQAPDIRPPGPDIRRPGHPGPGRKSGATVQKTPVAQPLQPGHPAPRPGHPASREGPDIRPPPGHPAPVCAQCIGPEAHVSLSHLPLRGPRLYILLPLLHLRVSLEIAHLIPRALLI